MRSFASAKNIQRKLSTHCIPRRKYITQNAIGHGLDYIVIIKTNEAKSLRFAQNIMTRLAFRPSKDKRFIIGV